MAARRDETGRTMTQSPLAATGDGAEAAADPAPQPAATEPGAPAAHPDYVVETRELTKIYSNRYIALNALNMRVRRNSVYGLVGPNGAGKSTAFRIMLGLQRPTAGEIRVFGEAMGAESASLRRRIGFLPTVPSFPRHMTPIAYLEFVARLAGMSPERTKIRLATLLQAVALADVGPQRIEAFSTGMVTRLGIAAALMNDPELLVLDEPTYGLDPAGRKQMIELIRELSGRSRTIIIATHILNDVERVCTDVGVISQGRLIYDGPMTELRRLARQDSVTVEIEGDSGHFEQGIGALDESGAVRWERIGAEIRITFLGTHHVTEYVKRVLALVERSGVELLRLDTGSHEVEEAFLRRLEEDRQRGFGGATAVAAHEPDAQPDAAREPGAEPPAEPPAERQPAAEPPGAQASRNGGGEGVSS